MCPQNDFQIVINKHDKRMQYNKKVKMRRKNEWIQYINIQRYSKSVNE